MKVVIVSKHEPPPAFVRDVKEVLGVEEVEVVRVEGKPCDVMKALKEVKDEIAGVAVFLVGVPADVLTKVRAFAVKHGKPLYAGVAVAVEKAFCHAVPQDRRVTIDGECLEYYALAEGLTFVTIPNKFIKEYYGRKFPEYVRRS